LKLLAAVVFAVDGGVFRKWGGGVRVFLLPWRFAFFDNKLGEFLSVPAVIFMMILKTYSEKMQAYDIH
jgi:hypothetical protein